MTSEVAAVYGRDVPGLEYAQLVEVVPVEKVAVEPPHSLERTEDLFHAIDHLRSRDESEVHTAHSRQQLQTDVGRRCAQGEHWLRVFLEIVGSEPVRFLRHELLEIRPVQLCVAESCLMLGFGQMDLAQNCRRAERKGNARARQPYEHQRQRPQHEQKSV